MMWKVIGRSVVGTSHVQSGRGCEDALSCKVIGPEGEEVLICCAADGAGSAIRAAWAATTVVAGAVAFLERGLQNGSPLSEALAYEMAEELLQQLKQQAKEEELELNEYSCTLLGCVVTGNSTLFFQVGDGAIIRNDGSDFYIPIWWPHNGEYQNTTSFLVDDASLANLKVQLLEVPVTEVAIFTDGLQMLTLNIEQQAVHQPFFHDMFRYLRVAGSEEHVALLNDKLAAYLSGDLINSRTNDDKTLLLATRMTV